MQTDTLKQIDHTIVVPSNSSITIPSSWKITHSEKFTQVTTPENDCSIHCLELPMLENIEATVLNAWQFINPLFNFPISHTLSLPVISSWEKSYKIDFQVPTSESRIVMSLAHIFNNKAYVCLIDGTMAGLSRRGAELNRIIESWKPINSQEIQPKQYSTQEWLETDKQNFEDFIIHSMKKLNIPGVAIAIIRQDGKIVYQAGLGIKSLSSNQPVTADTLFMIGSTTKPLTTLLMAKLVAAKKLSWETPVIKLLNNFSLADEALSKTIQLQQTVSASTGMPRRDLDWIFKYSGIKPEDRISQMRQMRPTTKLGETFQYSNYLFMVGGYAAAHAYLPNLDLETAYETAMRQCIFEPLLMKRTVLKTEAAMQLGAAFPHTISYNGQLCESSLAIERCCYSIAPAGAVWSTVTDLSNYLLMEMNKGNFDNKNFIDETSLLERRKPRIKIGENSSYGLGLFLANEQGLNIIGHGGNTFGFSSDLFFIPEQGIGMVVLTNVFSANAFLSAVKQRFLELTFAIKPQAEAIVDYAMQERSALINKNLKSIVVTPDKTTWINNLVGKYFSENLGNAVLTKMKDKSGFMMQFEEWQTELGGEIDDHGKKFLVLLNGPVPGVVKLAVENNGDRLILSMGQEYCDFKRIA